MSAIPTENAFMASLLADLDASIFDEELSPISTKRLSSQPCQSTRKVSRSNQTSTTKRSLHSQTPSIQLSQSPSPSKRLVKKARHAESFAAAPIDSQTWRAAERAEEIKAVTEHLLENTDDWMQDLLSPSPKQIKKEEVKLEARRSNKKSLSLSASPNISDSCESQPNRYTRCIIDEVIDGQYIPKRYHDAPAAHYHTKGVQPKTVTSAMQRRQRVLYLYELEQIKTSSSQEKQNGKQKQGKKCRVILRDEWLTTPTCAGDIVHLIGEWKDELDEHIEKKETQRIEVDFDDPDEELWSGMQSIPSFFPTERKKIISTMTLASSVQSIDQQQEEADGSLVDNLLILHPDILLSATAVSTVIRCTRRSYLQSKVKASGPSGEDAPSESLLMGKMLHEVLQSCLTGRPKLAMVDIDAVKTKEENEKFNPFPTLWKGPKPTNFSSCFVKEQIESQVQCSLQDILSADLDTETAADKLWEAAAPFGQFAQRYLACNDDELIQKDALAVDARSPVPPLVRVVQVLDVEEDIWSPMYGLKGFVDVSVEVEVVEGDSVKLQQAAVSNKGSTKASKLKGRTYVMPLELKTGRSIDKIQHQAQTMLYMLMMSDRYHQTVDRGLLYYSKTSSLHLIRSVQKEVRGLLMARNELADYLSRRPEAGQSRGELPPTINDERDCGRCYAVDECMLYKRAVEGELPNEDTSPIASLYQDKVAHLSEKHAVFFKHWEHLLTMEEDDIVRFRRQLWTMTAAAREGSGRCLSNMIIATNAKDNDGTTKRARSASGMNERIVYQLMKSDHSSVHLGGVFAIGDPISVSIEPDFYSVAQGHLLDLSSNIITIAVDRDLQSLIKRIKHSKPIFRIDKEEFASGMAKVRYNLARLFFKAPLGDVRRRELIVDLKEPRFTNLEDAKTSLAANDMNADQRQAVEMILTAKDYALIVGMPGTGKTTIIVELIKQLIARGNTILLASYTHSAVDTICRKLAKQESVHLLRLGSTDRVHSDIQKFTPKPVTSVEELQEQIMQPNVVATTCLSISHALFGKRKFDYCIVDEASQITLPTCLGPLRYADKFILVGDSMQLPPLVKNASAKEAGLDISLFDLLQKAHPQAVAQLRVQYRMNEDIMKLSNELVYEGRLSCGNEEIRQSSLSLPCLDEARTLLHGAKGSSLCSTQCWIERVFQESTRALFIDTDSVPGRERRVGETLLENDVEADIVTQISAALSCAGVPLNEIAIITPYRQQLRALVHKLGPAAASDKIEVLTADKSQGRDKDVVVISLVRSNEIQGDHHNLSEDTAGIGQLLNDVRRINVALTRARKKLIIVGSRSTLSRSKLLLQLWNLMEKNSWTMNLTADQLRKHQNLVSTVFAPLSSSSTTTTPIKKKMSNASQSSLFRQRRILLDVVNELG